LKYLLEILPLFSNILKDCEAMLLKSLYEVVEDPSRQEILDIIMEFIEEDAKLGTKANNEHTFSNLVFAMKSGIHGLLDVARVTYCETMDEINKVCYSF
jgi:DNA mismatch repair protein MSH4